MLLDVPLDSVLVYVPDTATRLELDLYLEGIQCGFPSPAADHVKKRLDLNDWVVKHPAATFFVTAVGDSMRPGIQPGDLLVVDRAVTAVSGSVVVAVIGGEFCVKRLRVIGSEACLVPENPAYPSIALGDGVEVIIWGVVTHVVHKP